MDIKELEKSIKDYEAKLSKTRNPVEKSKYESMIANAKQEIRTIKNKTDKEVILQKDVPVTADHKENTTTKRQITNTGNTFTALL